MAIYKYYAVIEKEDGGYIVSFPDLENCYTQGDTLSEAVVMAEDVLGLLLSVEEEEGKLLPKASPAKDLKLPEGASLVLIEVNTDDFREAV